MNIEAWYSLNFESRLAGRYITLDHIIPLLKEYENVFHISSLGTSELGATIPLLKIGNGRKNILAWSQMHGNESTTTKSILDFLKFLNQKEAFQSEIKDFLDNFSLYLIPMLNPDGASLYTRENANSVDLNRDAKDLSQKESIFLRALFDQIKPELCLNLHDQRSIFGLENGLPASISFLSPAANKERTITIARKKAMEYIAGMNATLQNYIPDQIGRYNDSFNDNCVGDSFQLAGVPTILFEAGHIQNDYLREKTREYIFYSLANLFGITDKTQAKATHSDYFLIPENIKNYKDFILRNVLLNYEDTPISIAIQYSERLKDGAIVFIPEVKEIGDLSETIGHIDIDVMGANVLVNSQNSIRVGDEVSIIVNKKDKSIIYFDKSGLSF